MKKLLLGLILAVSLAHGQFDTSYNANRLRGRKISTCVPTNGQFYSWNSTTSQFEWTTLSTTTTWDAIAAPTGNAAIAMAAKTTTFTWNAATGASTNLFNLIDTANNTGTGYLVNLDTASASTLKPFRVGVVGTDVFTITAAKVVNIGFGDVRVAPSATKATLYMGDTGLGSPAGADASSMATGMKLQLYGTAGAAALSNYAMGVTNNVFWSNSNGAHHWYKAGVRLMYVNNTDGLDDHGLLIVNQVQEGMDTMTYAGTITLDVALGSVHKTTTVNATGNATINANGVTAGQHLWVIIVNDATSGKTITFGTNFKTTATVVGTTSRTAIIHFVSDAANFYEVSRTLGIV